MFTSPKPRSDGYLQVDFLRFPCLVTKLGTDAGKGFLGYFSSSTNDNYLGCVKKHFAARTPVWSESQDTPHLQALAADCRRSNQYSGAKASLSRECRKRGTEAVSTHRPTPRWVGSFRNTVPARGFRLAAVALE